MLAPTPAQVTFQGSPREAPTHQWEVWQVFVVEPFSFSFIVQSRPYRPFLHRTDEIDTVRQNIVYQCNFCIGGGHLQYLVRSLKESSKLPRLTLDITEHV